MSAQPIEIILSRQLADSLSIPIFIVDTHGNLLFYNEPAEELLGMRFEETGFMSVEEWSTIFKPEDEEGRHLPGGALPLVRTLNHQAPMHGEFWIHNMKKKERIKISVTSYPIIGRPHRFIGAVALFWKSNT